MKEEILQVKYDSRKSFYDKAKVTTHLNEQGRKILSLYSYDTLVCYIDLTLNKAVVISTYSQTTLRHIKEFLKQQGFKAESKKQIIEDYWEEK